MKIEYPIVTISKGSHIEFVKIEEGLKKCNKRALKNRFYNKLTIIDSDSDSYKIQRNSHEGVWMSPHNHFK